MRRRLITIGAALVLLAALAGGGVAWATAADDDVRATGPAAERAGTAALAHVGGGEIVGVEREGAGWEVEVARADGSVIEVELDEEYRVLTAGSEEDEDDSGEDETDE